MGMLCALLQQGMSLSERALYTGVIRTVRWELIGAVFTARPCDFTVSSMPLQGGTTVHKGTPLPVFSEKDVFKALDIPYAEPKDRDL